MQRSKKVNEATRHRTYIHRNEEPDADVIYANRSQGYMMIRKMEKTHQSASAPDQIHLDNAPLRPMTAKGRSNFGGKAANANRC